MASRVSSTRRLIPPARLSVLAVKAVSAEKVKNFVILLNLQSMQIMAANYIGDNDPRSALISPIYADLKALAPLLIHVGSDEMLLDDSIRLARKAQRDGVDVTLKIYERMWHVFHLNARLMPEARRAIEDFGAFIRERYHPIS
jgi:acetyl esterase/lipase